MRAPSKHINDKIWVGFFDALGLYHVCLGTTAKEVAEALWVEIEKRCSGKDEGENDYQKVVDDYDEVWDAKRLLKEKYFSDSENHAVIKKVRKGKAVELLDLRR